MPDFFETIYTERAADYDRLVAREDYQHNILRALSSSHPLAGSDVVEMGAGTGRLTRLLAPRVKSILACDRSKAMLDVAADHLKESSLDNWRLVVADNRRLPVADGVADISIAGWSFGHSTGWQPRTWPDEIDRAVAQMRRVLRPGGTAIILETLGTGRETPQPPTDALAAYYQLLEEKYGFVQSWIRTDYRFESPAEAEELTRFFFGDALADRVARDGLVIVPECTGVWALTVWGG
jgi:ubiquinone/menaquinone biosynthesis C-methylase UbiE